MTEKKEKTKKKRGFWSRCCIATLIAVIIIFVLLAGGCAVGLYYANGFLKSNYDITIGEGWNILTGVLNSDGGKIVSHPAEAEDETRMYSEMKKALFLNENADLKGAVEQFIDSALANGDAGTVAYYAAKETDENDFLSLIEQLYSDGNLDLTRLREFINNDTDIEAVYDRQLTARINGNALALTMESLLTSQMEKDGQLSAFAPYVHIRQIDFSRRGEESAIRLIASIDTEKAAMPEIEKDLSEANIPGIVASVVKLFMPSETYFSVYLTLSDPVGLDITLNTLSDQSMHKLLSLVEKVSGEDILAPVKQQINDAVASLREQFPYIFDILDSVDDEGCVTFDIYGLLADMLSADKPEESRLLGPDIAAFVIGTLGSDAEQAIADKIEENGVYGQADWQKTQAQSLISAMADSFAMAENYFVNGTDENGDKILSVDSGIVTGAENVIGRVYSDAAGNLYYKKSGGKFKIYISPQGQVSAFKRSGYDEYVSTGLHYTSGGKDFTLYKSPDGTAIYGVSGGEIQPKNGTYTELTTLYADEDGNVYSRQNEQGTLIEITKEKLSLDTIYNVIASENADGQKLLDLIDFSALRQNGVSHWLSPVRITEAQLGAMIDEVLDEYLGDEIKKTNPAVAYCAIEDRADGDFIRLGITMDLSQILPEEYASLADVFLSDRVYAEVVCEVTTGKNQEDYAPVEIIYNNLSGEYTEKLMDIIGKLTDSGNYTGELENMARSIRSAVSELNETVKITFVDGAVETASPAEIIIPLITDKIVSPEKFASAVDMLLKSDSASAIALAKYENPDFADDEWVSFGTKLLAENLSRSFILNSGAFLVDGQYSLDKIMDIIEDVNFSLDDIKPYLDYETMRTKGFDGWKQSFAAEDVAVGAIVDRIKSDAFAGFENADPVIEYVHMFTRGEREFASLAVSVNLRSMLSGNEVFDRILDVLDDRLFASVILDVTDGAESYEPASIAINDLTEQQTDEIFDVISLFDDRFDKESLFSEAVRQVRSSFDDIRDGIQFEITDGAVVFAPPQQIIYDAIIDRSVAADFTPDDMTDALTAFTLAGNAYFDSNNGFVANTSSDEADRQFWNGVLKEKYFMQTDINSLFTALTSGAGVYETVTDSIDKNLIAPGGKFAHTSRQQAVYSADNEQLSYLFRINSGAVADMMQSTVMQNIEIYDIRVTQIDGAEGISVTIAVPTEDVLDYMGNLGAALYEILDEILPARLAVDVTWTKEGATQFTVCGMTMGERDELGRLIYCVTGQDIFAEESDVAKAADKARQYVDDHFEYGFKNGQEYFRMADFYTLAAENLFAPAADKPDISADDVFDAMKALYETPENSAGEFDAAMLEYVSDPNIESALSQFVHDSSYEVVGAGQEIEPGEPLNVNITATIRYAIDFGAEAKKLLPDNMYITLKYYVRPYFDGDGQISLDNAALDISFNLSENTDAIEKCLEYFDIDVQAAIELARTQLDTYVLDILGRM